MKLPRKTLKFILWAFWPDIRKFAPTKISRNMVLGLSYLSAMAAAYKNGQVLQRLIQQFLNHSCHCVNNTLIAAQEGRLVNHYYP